MNSEQRARLKEALSPPAGSWVNRPGDVASFCDPVSDEISLHHIAIDPVGWARAVAKDGPHEHRSG
jgi:hypothetical protein